MDEIETALSSADPKLGRVIRAVVARIGRQRITPSRATPFEALARAIVYQGVSGRAAATIFAHLKQLVPGQLDPATLLALPSESVRAAGLSTSKANAVRNLATWFQGNPILAQALPTLPDPAVADALGDIPGVGPWTVNVFLIFSLGRPDVMPAGDLGIRRGVQLTYGLTRIATPPEVRERSEKWRPYRSIASVYLWNAVKLKLDPGELVRGDPA